MKLSEEISARLLRDIFEEVHNELKKSNFRYVKIERPERSDKRSIDIIAWSQNDNKKRIHLKITVDSAQISGDELRDLKAMSRASSSKPLIIGEFERKIDLHDEVIYMKDDVPVINPTTLSRLLEKSKDLYIISRRGEFVVKIKGEKLRKKREELGYSLGEVAERLGVSRKAIYEYERNTFGVRIDYAEDLLDMFGEDIAEPFDIFSHEPKIVPSQEKVESRVEREIAEVLRSLGADIYSTKKTFFDLAAKVGSKGLLIGYERASSPLSIREKAEELAKISEFDDIMGIIVLREGSEKMRELSEGEVKYVEERRIGSIKELI